MRLILAEWEDSRQPVPQWHRADDYSESSFVKCKSVGWVVFEDDKVIALAGNMGDEEDNPQVSGVIQIPKSCIVKMRVLIKDKK